MSFKKKGGPTRPFTHADNCPLVKAEPGFEIQWQEVESWHWQAVCQCGVDNFYEEPTGRRARLDPLELSTFRHAGHCVHRDTTDPALLRAILKVRDGAGGGYWWVNVAPANAAGRFRTTPSCRWASCSCSMRTRQRSCSTSTT